MTDPGQLMRSDMAAQPAVLAALAGRRAELLAAIRAVAGAAPAGTVVVARGSSDYAAVFGRYVLEAATNRPVALAAPSLATLYDIDTDLSGWLAVGVSQSGRTPEIVAVLERYAGAGARTLAVTNEEGSAIEDVADLAIELGAGEERAVPATKTFTAQLAAFALIAEALGPVPWGGEDWDTLPGLVASVLEDTAPPQRATDTLAGAEGVVCLARGYLVSVALEAALKLREAAGVRAEGWSVADFRHGPITVAGPQLPVLAISAAGPARPDVQALASDLAQRGSPVVELADEPGAALPYPRGLAEPLAAIPAAVRAHQLAYALARVRGLDPDHPAGLAKVTPTE